MEYKIKSISQKKKTLTQEEKDIIDKALISYQIVLGQYERYTDSMKQKDLIQLSGITSVDNPFSVGGTTTSAKEPTLDETKEFVYSSWAEAVANVLTPYICEGRKKRAIRRKAFRDVKGGKYLNNKVRVVMQEFINRLSK